MPRNGSQTIFDRRAAGQRRLVLTCICGRRGDYDIDRAAARWGDDGMLTMIRAELTANCPKQHSPAAHDRCKAVFET
jgi:hypothetical protein